MLRLKFKNKTGIVPLPRHFFYRISGLITAKPPEKIHPPEAFLCLVSGRLVSGSKTWHLVSLSFTTIALSLLVSGSKTWYWVPGTQYLIPDTLIPATYFVNSNSLYFGNGQLSSSTSNSSLSTW